jgi:hypothetical protein
MCTTRAPTMSCFLAFNLSRVWTFMKTLVVDGKIRIDNFTPAAVLFATDKRSEDNLREITRANLLKTKLRGQAWTVYRSLTDRSGPTVFQFSHTVLSLGRAALCRHIPDGVPTVPCGLENSLPKRLMSARSGHVV